MSAKVGVIALLGQVVGYTEDDHTVISRCRTHGSSKGSSRGSCRPADGRRGYCKHHSGIKLDSNAALGKVGRKGNGKLRHIKVGNLWLQELADEQGVMVN